MDCARSSDANGSMMMLRIGTSLQQACLHDLPLFTRCAALVGGGVGGGGDEPGDGDLGGGGVELLGDAVEGGEDAQAAVVHILFDAFAAGALGEVGFGAVFAGEEAAGQGEVGDDAEFFF